jgi:hypothetical protein
LMTPAAKVLSAPDLKKVPKFWLDLQEGDALLNPPWFWHEIRNGPGFNVGIATRENHPPWILRNNWLFSALLEIRATPRVARNIIPKDKKALLFLSSIPYLSFTIGLVKELIHGPSPSPLFTAAFNPCDEHDPGNCTTTFLDKTVYSEDVVPIPYRE